MGLRLHTLAEVVARHPHLSLRSLQDGARAKPPRFEHMRIGRKRLLTDEQIDQLLKQHVVHTTPTDDDLAGVRERLIRARTPRQQRGNAA